MSKIAVYIPNYNGAEFLKRVFIPDGFICVVMDNVSTDDSKSVCLDRGFVFIENDLHVNRVENWIRCIEHFKISNFEWLKWLFVGDELCHNSANILKRTTTANPDVAVIVFEYDIRVDQRLYRWRSKCHSYGLLEPSSLATNVLTHGNIFGSFIGVCVSRRAVTDLIYPYDLEWVADLWLNYNAARNGGALFVSENIGVFNSNCRKFYSKKLDIWSYIEALEVMRRIERSVNHEKSLEHTNEYVTKLLFAGLNVQIFSSKGFLNALLLLTKFIFHKASAKLRSVI